MQVDSVRVNARQQRMNWKDYSKSPRIYVFVKDENLFDNLSNRQVRPHTLYKKFAVKPALEALGLNADDCKVTWSQKAGCSCPCSPGFVVKSKSGRMLPRSDVYVDVVGSDVAVAEGATPRSLQIAGKNPTNVQELIQVLLTQ